MLSNINVGNVVKLKYSPHEFVYGASRSLSGALVRVTQIVYPRLSVRIVDEDNDMGGMAFTIHVNDILHTGVSAKLDAVLDELEEWDRVPKENVKVKVTMLSNPTFISVNQNL